MHRPPLPGSLQRRAGTACWGLSRSHRNHSRDPASNRTGDPCCAPDVLADGDTGPPDPFDASGRGNSSLHRSANHPAKSAAASHAATDFYPNRHAIAHSDAPADRNATTHGYPHGNAAPDANTCTHP